MSAVVLPVKIHSEGTYTFSSAPRALFQHKRKVPREEICAATTTNDGGYQRRMLKGGCYPFAPFAIWTSSGSPPEGPKPREVPARRAVANRRLPLGCRASVTNNPHQRRNRAFLVHPSLSETPAVKGRRHLEVYTEPYLEELKASVDELEVGCQTEKEENYPSSPSPSEPSSSIVGVDASTQLDDGELYDFDMEVQPVLEVLVSTCVQRALVEVLEEEEEADIRRQQRRFQQLRIAYREGEIWLKNEESRISGGDNAKPPPSSLHAIHSWGFSQTPVDKDLEKAFLPWLLDEVQGEVRTVFRQDSQGHEADK